MGKHSILIADSSETSRKKIASLLSKKGYKIFQATDGAGVIRISRGVSPDLVIMDNNLWGMSAYEAASIIEENGLSTVLFMTNNPNKAFYEKLQKMNVFAYVIKPVHSEQLYQMVEFSIMNSDKINLLTKKIEKLESTLEKRKKIDRAKGIIMEKLSISENNAYNFLRKKSMDKCVPIDKIADEIIQDFDSYNSTTYKDKPV